MRTAANRATLVRIPSRSADDLAAMIPAVEGNGDLLTITGGDR